MSNSEILKSDESLVLIHGGTEQFIIVKDAMFLSFYERGQKREVRLTISGLKDIFYILQMREPKVDES